jgi:hypothetical protein
MKLIEELDSFHAQAGKLGSYAPNEFPKGSMYDYYSCRDAVTESWQVLRLKLKRDQDKVPIIDAKLKEGIDLLDAYQKALDDGQTPDPAMRERGRDALWVIYNMNPSAFR